MAITINQPGAGAHFGPGMLWDISSSFVGPFPSGTKVLLELQDPLLAYVVAWSDHALADHSANGTLGYSYVGNFIALNPGHTSTADGAAGTLRVRIQDSGGTTLESATQNVTIDFVSGAVYLNYIVALTQQSSATSSSLASILAAVRQHYQNAP